MKYEVQNQNVCFQTEGLKRGLAFVNQVNSNISGELLKTEKQMVLYNKTHIILQQCLKVCFCTGTNVAM